MKSWIFILLLFFLDIFCFPNDLDCPILGPKSIGYMHASYQNPKQDEELNRRESLSMLPSFCVPQSLTCSSTNNIYRSIDGSCNNLNNPYWGRSSLPYRRILPPISSINECFNSNKPTARNVSLNLLRRSDKDINQEISIYVMIWGQLIDHDMIITPHRKTAQGQFVDCCHPKNFNHEDCCPIFMSFDDPFYKPDHRPKCQSVLRSQITFDESCSHSDVLNGNTAWLDASFVYGSTDKRSLELRALVRGRLKVSVDRRDRQYPPVSNSNEVEMEFGDHRSDSTWATAVVATSLIRYHNKLADNLFLMHPDWNDEKIFQEVRKIVGALVQHFTYSSFLNIILGFPNNLHIPENAGFQDFYNPSVDGRIYLEVADVAFRLHTLIGSHFLLVDRNFNLKSKILLRDLFRNPIKILEGDTYNDLLRGLSVQPLHNFNNIYSPEMTEWMFRRGSEDFGLDIASITVQRGRDHNLPGYIHYKEACNLGRVSEWSDLLDLIPFDIVNRLRKTYESVEDIDAFTGMISEEPMIGTEVGPTVHCILTHQFIDTRNGDRFFYTRPNYFSSRQLTAIKNMRLSDILCEVSDNIKNVALPDDIFRLPNEVFNPIIPCSHHRKFDINAWR